MHLLHLQLLHLCAPNLFAAEKRLQRDFTFIACFTLAHSRVEGVPVWMGITISAMPLSAPIDIPADTRTYPTDAREKIGKFEQKQEGRPKPFSSVQRCLKFLMIRKQLHEFRFKSSYVYFTTYFRRFYLVYHL